MKYQIRRTQQLGCSIDAAWDFFSSPCNLSVITPKDMNFKVITKLPDGPVYTGMIIDYTVFPFWGIALKWRTIITQVSEKRSFEDYQQKGPYKSWNHLHEFITNEHGVLMKDTVDYELPLGLIGRIVHKLIVKKKLNHIFDYRYQVVEKLFNAQVHVI
jgi:ligand-binding SRPBCC domain-containing protein